MPPNQYNEEHVPEPDTQPDPHATEDSDPATEDDDEKRSQ